jgi:hypothetical protein
MIEFLSGFFSGLGITAIIVAFLENKYHIINRIRKRVSIIKNSGTEANLSLEYKIDKDFNKIFEKFKDKLRNDKFFKVDKKTDTKIKLQYKSISMNLILTPQKTLFIELDKIGCGIKDLKEKLNEFLGKISEFERDKTLLEFINCHLTFTLPYKWDNMNIWTPKGLVIKKYNVGFSDENYKSEVEISLNKVNIKSDTKESINYIIDKFI